MRELIRRWRERREARQHQRMIVLLTLSPSALDEVKRQLAEDDWTERREGR